MDSQKNLSQSSLILMAAPPRRLEPLFAWDRRLPGYSTRCFFCLGRRASWLAELSAARGGLVGGDGRPEEGTSGIPLGPCGPGSAVVEALQGGDRVDEVAGGKDVDLVDSVLAVITTPITRLHTNWRHLFGVAGLSS